MSTTTHVTELTIEEMVESMTGYEEIAVAKHFGDEVTTLLEKKPTMGLRSLVFVHAGRDENTKADEAKKVAMSMTVKAATTYFRDDSEEDVDPVDLETETGKEGVPST